MLASDIHHHAAVGGDFKELFFQFVLVRYVDWIELAREICTGGVIGFSV